MTDIFIARLNRVRDAFSDTDWGDDWCDEVETKLTAAEQLDTTDWCCDDHVVRPGDTPGQWHLYSLGDFNDGPPFATFHPDDNAEKRARFCASALKQLADKEREIDRLQGKWKDAGDRCPQCGTGNTKLTAAEKVVEEIEKLLSNMDDSGPIICAKIARVVAKHKLQGGE